MNRRAREADLGFSLIELLVTIVLAAIIFMAMVPLFVGAQQKNAADSFRLMAMNVAQDRIEKIRTLDFASITVPNLSSTTFDSGEFGPTASVASSGGATRNLRITYAIPPTSSTPEFKTVIVTVDWTAPPQVKPVTIQTVVYRQYAGPSIHLSTDPGQDENNVVGDASLTTVTLKALPTQAWLGPNTASVQFAVCDGGGTLVKTQTVKWGDNTPSYGVDNNNFFWWSWDATGAVDGTYVVYATASSGTYAGQTEHFSIVLARGITSAVPTGLQIVPGATSASLTWISVPTAASYKVYRGSSSTGPWTLVGSPAVATYTDQGLTSSTTYWYAVSSVGADSTESTKCVAVSTTTLSAAGDITPPTVPTWASPAITADVVAPGVMELRWNASTDAGVGMQDYRIWRSTNGTTGWTVIATWTNLLSLVYDDTVGPSQTRYYRITARDVSLNESTASSTVSATTAAAISQWTLTITNTINGANKNRYVWVQNTASHLYYNQSGGTSAAAPAGVLVPSKNGTASFSLLPNGVYNIWVSSSAASKPGSGAAVQTSVTINGANSGANIS